MQTLRAFGFILLSLTFLASFVAAKTADETNKNSKANTVAQQQLVEDVVFQKNRRLRGDDLLYYIKTRTGDVYNPQQLERDLRELLSLNFFDKIQSRVLTEPGVRGGVKVIFEVVELPIIRDLQFKGSSVVPESDILKAFREQRVGISKEAVYDPAKAKNATRILRELFASKRLPERQN
ncbi:MAG: POTRA domain-containing protein [Pyrinomonadaceae bacterium]